MALNQRSEGGSDIVCRDVDDVPVLFWDWVWQLA